MSEKDDQERLRFAERVIATLDELMSERPKTSPTLRGPQIFGKVSYRYSLAFGLHKAAIDHKRTCSANCNVSLGTFRMSAEFIMDILPDGEVNHDAASMAERQDFNGWEWPS